MSVTLKDVGSGYKRTAINENFQAIENEINNNLLSKNGGVGLEADLDANSQKIINLEDGLLSSDAVNLAQLQGAISAISDGTISSQVERKEGSDAVGRVFTFAGISYTPAANNLAVYRNGQRLDVAEDYTETTTTSITLTFDPNTGDKFVFITNATVTSSVSDTSAITHVQDSTTYNLATFLQLAGLFELEQEVQLGSDAVGNTFTLSTLSYVPGANNLTIYRNGVRLEITEDYLETSSNVVALTFPPNPVDRFIFITKESAVSGVMKLPSLPVYADESAASSAGLTAGDVYRTPAGELRVKL